MPDERPFPPINTKNTALVLHDFQYDFLGKKIVEPETQSMIKRTRELIDLVHSIGMSVIYSRALTDPALRFPEGRADYLTPPGGRMMCVKGTRGAEIVDELKPAPSDLVVTKAKYSVFYGTPMESIVRIKGIWIFLIVGGALNRGVEFFAREAITRDVVNIVVEDLTYCSGEAERAASLANIGGFLGYVVNSGEIMSKLKTLGNAPRL